MPWYKFELTGGKGHPNHKIEYKWYDTPIATNTGRDILWETWAEKFSFERCYNGRVTLAKVLPRKARDEMIAVERQKIERAQEAIACLVATTVKDEVKKE